MLTSIFLKFLASKVGSKLPAWLWEIIIAALLIGAGALAHHIAVVRHDNSVRAEQRRADDDAAKAAVKSLNATIADLTSKLRKATDAKQSAIAADAGTLRVSGPGAARCPRLPGPASGHNAPAAKPDDAGPALPPADSAAVPWNWLVQRAEEHDQLLAEVEAWHAWHDQVVKVWPKK